jgi:ribonuclease HI
VSADLGMLAGLRIGFGMQTAKLLPNSATTLGGVSVLSGAKPEDQSRGDKDVVSLSLLEALLLACGLPDVEAEVPSARASAAVSLALLTETVTALRRRQLTTILNVNVRLLGDSIELSGGLGSRIAASLAEAIQVQQNRVAFSFEPGKAFPEIVEGRAIVALSYVLCHIREPEMSVLLQQESSFEAKIKRRAAAYDLAQTIQPTGSGPRSEGLSSRPVTRRTKEMFTDAPEAADAAIKLEELPERARQFERAVKTKLPPLPQAPQPQPGDTLYIYTDGASRGNPGPAAAGFMVLDAQGRLVHEEGVRLGECTNNVAEYKAVGEAARWIETQLGREFKLEFRLDSELVVKQLLGEWKLKDANLRQLALLTMNTLMLFSSYSMKHVPRAENARADALANQALDAK